MPSWGQILFEIDSLIGKGDVMALDKVRNKYMADLSTYTGRDTIVYASRWTSGEAVPQEQIVISDEDMQGFMEAVYGLKNDKLDLILHTPGGSAEATDSIVSYLRQKFNHIRIIIPQAAMSAGTMLACAADVIVMGKQSSLGPIDPQFIMQTPIGVQMYPAYAIIEQFKKAQKDCVENPQNINTWLPMLAQYGPALLVRCQDQIDFSRELVYQWLDSYMFKGEQSDKPASIAEYLANHGNFKTHSKHINAAKAIEIGLKVELMEADQTLQDKILSVFHASVHAFPKTTCTKIVGNQNGNSFIKAIPITATEKQ